MTKYRFLYLLSCPLMLLTLLGCSRSSGDIWDDTKSAGRHLQVGVRALAGDHESSRQINSRTDFEGMSDDESYSETPFAEYNSSENYTPAQYQENTFSNAEQPFIPLQDSNDLALANNVMASRYTPGAPNSPIPGIQAFRDPNYNPEWANVFRTIYFDYDSSLIKKSSDISTLQTIADYMRNHPRIYIFVEGHTCERGPHAYNLALGARRSATVRTFLINEGVNPDNIFTVTYGKDRPVVLEKHEEGWQRNRRAEFKIYER